MHYKLKPETESLFPERMILFCGESDEEASLDHNYSRCRSHAPALGPGGEEPVGG